MSDYYDKEMLHIEKERNRLLERISDRLDDITKELKESRRLFMEVPFNRLLVPILETDRKNVRTSWGVVRKEPFKRKSTDKAAGDVVIPAPERVDIDKGV